MADSVNKTQAIKDLLKENPKLMPLEISNLLKDKGIEVTRAFASVVKSNFNKKSGKETVFTAKKKSVRAAKTTGSLDIDLLLDVKKICDKYGKDTVIGAITALSKLS